MSSHTQTKSKGCTRVGCQTYHVDEYEQNREAESRFVALVIVIINVNDLNDTACNWNSKCQKIDEVVRRSIEDRPTRSADVREREE